jgi:hypothetical protein
LERQRKREGVRRVLLQMGYGVGNKHLTVGQIFIAARERITLDVIKMNFKIICKNSNGYYFL